MCDSWTDETRYTSRSRFARDETIDAGPFAFKPYRLASLVDPKNIDLLKDGKKALGKAADAPHHRWFVFPSDKDGRPGAGDEPGASAGTSQRHDRQPETAGDVPRLVLTGSGGEDAESQTGGDHIQRLGLVLLALRFFQDFGNPRTPLAVILALAFATQRLTKANLIVRVLGSCDTTANASTICTDKTGTLNYNDMTLIAGSVRIHGKAKGSFTKHAEDFSIDEAHIDETLSPSIQDLFNKAIHNNSTAFQNDEPETGDKLSSVAETALLKFAKENGQADYKQTRESADVFLMISSSSEHKATGVVVKISKRQYCVYLKGADILTKKCTNHIVVERSSHEADFAGLRPIDELGRDNIQRTIIIYAYQTLRAIAIRYRDFESWPPPGVHALSEEEVLYGELPLRPGMREAVADCHKAGVTVEMCTGDNDLTVRSIALQCDIYAAAASSCKVFQQLDKKGLQEVMPHLQILARSSPDQLLVERLRELHEIVGVTGDGTNDGPALKKADVTTEASAIILMDDNFASIVEAMWGRCVNDAVRKVLFPQFQDITAVIVTFVSVASIEEVSVLSVVQLLWTNTGPRREAMAQTVRLTPLIRHGCVPN
ncbi:hypothetical protein C8Q74DRAFT_1373530 [Fomes fomentarius]|nr:hypothetical protein C8Q74DRAFT_1373530 [Fomes fomentarius]